jgi:hypothetical protein
VGYGTHEALAKTVDLFEEFRAQRLLAQLRAFERQRRVVGEGVEDRPVVLRRRQAPQGEDAHRATGRGQRDGAQFTGRRGVRADADRLTRAGTELGQFIFREWLAGRRDDLQDALVKDQQ